MHLCVKCVVCVVDGTVWCGGMVLCVVDGIVCGGMV